MSGYGWHGAKIDVPRAQIMPVQQLQKLLELNNWMLCEKEMNLVSSLHRPVGRQDMISVYYST